MGDSAPWSHTVEPYTVRVVFGVWLAPSAPTKAWPTARAPAATRHPSPAPAGRYTSAPHSPAEKRTHRTHGVSEHVRLAAVFFRPPTAPHGLSPLPASRSTSWMSTRAIATGTSAKRSTAGRVRRPPPTPTPSHTHTHSQGREGRPLSRNSVVCGPVQWSPARQEISRSHAHVPPASVVPCGSH